MYPEYQEMTHADVCRAARDYCNSHISLEFGLDGGSDNYIREIRKMRPDVDAAWCAMFNKYVAHWEE